MVKRGWGFDAGQRGAMPPKRRSNTEMSTGYETLLSSVSELLRRGRQNAAKSVNAVLTTTYWLVGRRLVEFEQRGKERAVYGSQLLKRLSGDLQSRFGRGSSERNLEQMRQFYLQWGNPQTLSADSAAGFSPEISQTPSAKLSLGDVPLFSLSWSHYVRLLSVTDLKARQHYEEEALRRGWSVRQYVCMLSTEHQRYSSENQLEEQARCSMSCGKMPEDVPLTFNYGWESLQGVHLRIRAQFLSS